MEVSDDGMYECQISTTPTTSHSMAVSVIGKLNLEKILMKKWFDILFIYLLVNLILLKRIIFLVILVPHTTIMGNSDLYIEAGSTINLTCIIQAESMRDTHIYWNYEGKVNITSRNSFIFLIILDNVSTNVNNINYTIRFWWYMQSFNVL